MSVFLEFAIDDAKDGMAKRRSCRVDVDVYDVPRRGEARRWQIHGEE